MTQQHSIQHVGSDALDARDEVGEAVEMRVATSDGSGDGSGDGDGDGDGEPPSPSLVQRRTRSGTRNTARTIPLPQDLL